MGASKTETADKSIVLCGKRYGGFTGREVIELNRAIRENDSDVFLGVLLRKLNMDVAQFRRELENYMQR